MPLPPEEPYDAFLLRTGCTKQVSALVGSATCHCGAPQDLMTLPAALPSPFPTYERPVQTPRDPSPAPHLCMPLSGRFFVPPPQAWSWPGRGSAFLDLNMHLYQPVPPRPDAGAASDAFLSSVGRVPTPHPQQLTISSTDQTPSSYPLRLARFFSATSSIASTINGTCLLPVPARSDFWQRLCHPENLRLSVQVCFPISLFRFRECNMVGIYTLGN